MWGTVKIRVVKVVLVIAVVIYAYLFFWSWAFYLHKMSAVGFDMKQTYDNLCEYRAKNGRWPEDLEVLVKANYHTQLYVNDPISHQPWHYFPSAKPGTKAILLAEPEPLEMGSGPS